MKPSIVLTVIVVLGSLLEPAVADDPPPPPGPKIHGSLSVGASLLLTGAGGDATRFDASLSVQPWRRLGIVAAVRALDDEPRSMMVTAGVEYQAAASRPRLVLSLYADVGLETAANNPVVGGGIRTTLVVIGPVGIVADTGLHLVIDGLDDTTLVIGSALMLAIAR